MPPQVNATITRVQAATAATGGRDDWDESMANVAAPAEPAGAGAEKWAGTAKAFLEEKASRSFEAGNDDVLERRILHVDSVDARAMGLDTNDVITFTDPAGIVRQATAAAIAIAELAGIPRELQTATIELRAA